MDSNTGLSVLGIGTGIVVNLLAMRPMHPVLKGSLFSLGGFLIIAGLWGVWRGPAAEGDSEAMKAPTTMTQDRPTNSPNVSGSGNTTIYNMNSEKEERVEPTGVGKYFCTTSLPVGPGKHGLLVEFGARRGQTNGFAGELHFTAPYVKQEAWVGMPLRTDKQGGALVQFDKTTWDDPSRLSYAEKFASPIITPRLSYYLYFEAEQPLQLKSVFFIEDPLALSDQVRMETLAKQIEACPR